MTTTAAGMRKHDPPTAGDFLAAHRGGGLFTEAVNQRAGSWLAVLANRIGAAPTVLTLANLVVGGGASVALAIAGSQLHPQSPAPTALAAAVFVLWQLAYSLDCADGQLARVTGQGSPAGARIDVLCDLASQIALVTAVSVIAHAYEPGLPLWFIATFAAAWMINLVTSVLQQGAAGASLILSRNPAVRLVKVSRDYGAMITVIALVIGLIPRYTGWLMAVLTAVSVGFLAASIAAAARESLRAAAAARTRRD